VTESASLTRWSIVVALVGIALMVIGAGNWAWARDTTPGSTVSVVTMTGGECATTFIVLAAIIIAFRSGTTRGPVKVRE